MQTEMQTQRGEKWLCYFMKRWLFFLLIVSFLFLLLLWGYGNKSQGESLQVVDPALYALQKKTVEDSLSKQISPDHPASHSDLWIDLNPEQMTIVRN